MICPNCKKKNIDNTRWCCYCGSLLDGRGGLLKKPAHAPAPVVKVPETTPPPRPQPPPKREAARKEGWRTAFWVALPILLLCIGLGLCVVFVPSIHDWVEARLSLAPTEASDRGTQTASDPFLAAQAQSAEEDWKSVYEDYILHQTVVYVDYGSKVIPEKTLTLDGLQYYKSQYSEPKFGLHDMDGNGVPELLIFNGASSLAAAQDYAFTCVNGQARYLGSVGFRGCALFCYADSPSKGLFCTDGSGGVTKTLYYEIRDGVISSEEADVSAVNTAAGPGLLPFLTVDEIRAMGWESFIQKALSRTPMQPTPSPTPGTVVPLNSSVQVMANVFLSAFSEQGAFERAGFDSAGPDGEDLVSFAFLYCKIHRAEALSVQGDYYTISLQSVNEVLNHFFGFALTDSQAVGITHDSSRQNAYRQYSSGYFYFQAADGASYNRLSVARQAEQLDDGSFRLRFDIYEMDIGVYRSANGAIDTNYYYITPDPAQDDPNLTWKASGTALVRIGSDNGQQTLLLSRYALN